METAISTTVTNQEPNEILRTLNLRKEKILFVANQISDLPINQENDLIIQQQIDKFKVALADIKEKRMPLTRRMNDFIGKFTSMEKEIQAGIDKLQVKRNQFAIEQKKLADKQRLAMELENAKAIELIALKANIEVEIRAYVNSIIEALKTGIINACKTVTKENSSEKLSRLQNMPTELNTDKYSAFISKQTSKNHDVSYLVKSISDKLKAELLDAYKRDIEEMKQGAILVLKDIGNMTTEEKEAWAKEEIQKVDLDIAVSNEIAEEKTDLAKQAEHTNLILESMSSKVEEPNVAIGLEIVVESKGAYPSICAYWFSVCYSTYENSIENKTIKSMMLDLARHAKNTGERLDVEGVIYKETLKAK
jgi:hypothetical protein